LTNSILKINNLKVFPNINSRLKLVKNISLRLKKGKTTCIVGESGSGKSLTALSVMRLLSSQLSMSGSIVFEGIDLLNLSKEEIRKKRGKDIAMIFQEPMTSLNPVLTIGYQIQEAISVHESPNKVELNSRVSKLLKTVGIPVDRMNSYPDELSGGQRQRVMIAMAISCSPKLLIADEPTTALDVTVQAQILNLLDDLKLKFEMTMLFITHDFGVVEDIADDVAVMFQGEIVEQGSVAKVLKNPKHPYTRALLDCVPDAYGKKDLKPIDYIALKELMGKKNANFIRS
jgi:peptide/nickel transport system ATP-binding protein